ncbi:hypothetical protein QYF36_018248 [Acer negundo]|nr:hypothetical protein QYF36_018248 [Acer negundo]
MEKWSEKWENQIIPIWINVTGLPLRLWNISFFQKLGSLFGELLFIESDILQRRRLDRARLLVLIPKGGECPTSVKIGEGRESFPIQMKKDVYPMDVEWLVDILDLNFKATIFEETSASEWTERPRGKK